MADPCCFGCPLDKGAKYVAYADLGIATTKVIVITIAVFFTFSYNNGELINPPKYVHIQETKQSKAGEEAAEEEYVFVFYTGFDAPIPALIFFGAWTLLAIAEFIFALVLLKGIQLRNLDIVNAWFQGTSLLLALCFVVIIMQVMLGKLNFYWNVLYFSGFLYRIWVLRVVFVYMKGIKLEASGIACLA